MERYETFEATDIAKQEIAEQEQQYLATLSDPRYIQTLRDSARGLLGDLSPSQVSEQMLPPIYNRGYRRQVVQNIAAQLNTQLNPRQEELAMGDGVNWWETLGAGGASFAGTVAGALGTAAGFYGEGLFGDFDYQKALDTGLSAKKSVREYLQGDNRLSVEDVANSNIWNALAVGGIEAVGEVGLAAATGGTSGLFSTATRAARLGKIGKAAYNTGKLAIIEDLPFNLGRNIEEGDQGQAEFNVQNSAAQVALAGGLGAGIGAIGAGLSRKFNLKTRMVNDRFEKMKEAKKMATTKQVEAAEIAKKEIQNEAIAREQQFLAAERNKVANFHPGKENLVDVPEYKIGAQSVNETLNEVVKKGGSNLNPNTVNDLIESSYRLDPEDVIDYGRYKLLKNERQAVGKALYDEAARPLDELGQVAEDYAAKTASKLQAIDQEIEKLIPTVKRVEETLGKTNFERLGVVEDTAGAAKAAKGIGKTITDSTEATEKAARRLPVLHEGTQLAKGQKLAEEIKAAVDGFETVTKKAGQAADRRELEQSLPKNKLLTGKKASTEAVRIGEGTSDANAPRVAKQFGKLVKKGTEAAKETKFEKDVLDKIPDSKKLLPTDPRNTPEFKQAYQKNRSFKNAYEKATDKEYKDFIERNADNYKNDPKASTNMKKDFQAKKQSVFNPENSKKLDAKDPETVEKAIEEIKEIRKKSNVKSTKKVRCK